MGLFAWIFVLLLEQCLAQPHAVLDLQAAPSCYHCDTHARHFPACLSEPVTCHPDEVCSISYGTGLPTIRCQKADACSHDVSHPSRSCTGGGVEVHPNQCELCCHTTACVQEINGLLLQEFPQVGVTIHQQGSINCYHCDQQTRHFPGCLSEPVTCLADEVCSISYGTGLPFFRCEKSNDCVRDVSHPMRTCAGGGIEVQTNECELCCSSSACVQDISGLLLQEFPYQAANQGIFCPGSCSETDIATCVHTATYCPADQFCEVGIDDHLTVQGHCKNAHELQKCHDDLARHPCTLTVGQPGHIAKCVWDCCQSKECLAAHFGAYMGTPPTLVLTQAPQVTNPPFTLAPIATPAPTPVTCMGCEGICQNNELYYNCPSGFCSLAFDDSKDGSRSFRKGCSTQEQCQKDWSDGWSKNPLCLAYIANPNKVSGQDNSCSFCCTSERCNEHITDTSVLYGVHI